ncbi:RPA-related protein RADX [Osmerus mordax]|uniref:RPA-related protein RADX n=1 Tax=Osmerus mordax TaxID=8014 RepID=UPI00350FD289
MACSGVLEPLTEHPQVSFLHSTLEPFFAGKTLTLKCHAPVTVIALQRHLSAQQNTGSQQAPDSYNFDIIVTDGVCQAKCLLDQGLNHLVHKNVLRSGIDIHINHCSFIHNEKRLGQSFVCINRIECGSPLRESGILLEINDLDSIPMLSKNGLGDISLQNDAPLQIGRKHYLALWNNEDPEGAVWVPNINPPDVVLDVSKILFLRDLESSLGNAPRPIPIIVRIIHKSRLRYYGKFGLKIDYPFQAYFEVADQSGTMSLVLWNELCLEWYQRLNVGTVLYLQNYTLKPGYPNRSRPHINNSTMKSFYSVEICLNARNPTASVIVVPPKSVSFQWGLPEVVYNFTPRSELDNLSDNSACDVIGLVTFVGRAERVKHSGTTGPEKYWTYRWVHAVDGTSNLPFILEIFASSQPEMFNGICPMTYLVCTQMRMCRVEGSLPYLTSSCETQIFITGFHKGQPYVCDPCVRRFIQWTKTQRDSDILRRAAVGGHYCYPPAPRIFTQSVTDGSAEVPLVAADELKRELESLQYREHKRLAIQGRIMAVQYRNLPAEALTDQGQTVQCVGVSEAAAAEPETQMNRETLPSGGKNWNIGQKRKLPRRDVRRFYTTRSRTMAGSETGHGSAVDEPMDQEESEEEEEEEEGPVEGGTDPTSHTVSTEGDVPSWESASWSSLKREVAVHLHPAGLDADHFSHKFRVHDQQLLLQLINLHPARWTREQTPDPRPPLSHHGYYHLTILGINQQVAVDAAFLPVMSLEDPRAVGLPQDPHDNRLLSCLSAGCLCPLGDPQSLSETPTPDPEEILATAEELSEAPVVCVLDLCHLGEDRIEVVINKVYRMTDVALI